MLILRHPREGRSRKVTGSVPLIGLCLAKCTVVDTAEKALPLLLAAIDEGYAPLMLYPVPGATLLDEALLDEPRHNEALVDDARDAHEPAELLPLPTGNASSNLLGR